MNVVVTPTSVKFGEVMGVMQFVNEVQDEGKRGCIFDSDIIEMAIVCTGWSLPSFLSTKKKGLAMGDLEGWI